MEVALSFVWMAIVFWLIFRALGQRNLLPLLRPAASATRDPPNISIVIPARNEAANLSSCLDGLLHQTYPKDRLSIIVVDDDSSDNTLAIGRARADKSGQVKVIECPSLPPHWCGKPHACWIGASAARADSEWFCFMDADVQAAPPLIGSAVAAARGQRLALLSLAPRQKLGSFAERLVMPCGLFLLAFYQDLETVQSPHSNKVTATGQFMLVHRQAYETVGGHAAVRQAICEDLELALLIKKAGGRVLLEDGKLLLTARMYAGWASLWTGFSKNLVEMLGGRTPTLIIAVAVLLLSCASILLPTVDAAGCAARDPADCVALIPALIGTAAAAALHIAGASYFRIPFWYGLMFPAGYAVGACLAMESLRRHWRGRIVWKGRSYP